MSDPPQGFAARLVATFLHTRYAALVTILALIAGAVGLFATPREEDPQIVVPVADIFIEAPGASALEVERLVATPLEKLLWQIDGVEYVYSQSFPDRAIVTVRFYVGEDREDSLLKLYTKVEQSIDLAPELVTRWVVKPIEIDDVPIIVFNLHSNTLDDAALRRIAEEVVDRLQGVRQTGRVEILGGRVREVRIELDPERLAAHRLTPTAVANAIRASNVTLAAGTFTEANALTDVRVGTAFTGAHELEDMVVAVQDGRPTYLRDVADVRDGPAETSSYTWFWPGPMAEGEAAAAEPAGAASVAITVAKQKGTNAVWVARRLRDAMTDMRGTVIPDDVHVTVTRDYGVTANQKINTLVEGLLIALVTVVALITAFLGWRAAFVVALAIPISYALTLAINYLAGYTINRVTLFALTLSLGLLVDDPITDVENISRYYAMNIKNSRDAVIRAVQEVRPALIMSTIAIILSFSPLLFITGMMGPYMRPMAINVPLTVTMSTLVAFLVTPWAALKFLRRRTPDGAPAPGTAPAPESWVLRRYGVMAAWICGRRRRSRRFLALIGLLFLASLAVPATGLVPLKMLPFDNKNEFSIMVDLPEGAPLERTDQVVRDLAAYLQNVPEVASLEGYVGVPAPMDFNGMVRHYFLREAPELGALHVNLLDKAERLQQSHTIGLRLRDELTAVAARHGANIAVVEVPPGPPVVQTLVAEVTGPPTATVEALNAQARRVADMLRTVPGIVDLDVSATVPYTRAMFVTDKEKAALNGISTAMLAQSLRLAMTGESVGAVHIPGERRLRDVVLRLPRSTRSGVDELLRLSLSGETGALVQVGELGEFTEQRTDPARFRKNLRPVSYVFAEVAGHAPAEIIFAAQDKLHETPLPDGFLVNWAGEGEWKITLDVFRDLGIAFGAALIGIFIVLMLQTRSAALSGIIMLAIPLTLIGIFPGFALLNLFRLEPIGQYLDPVFFTATAMIGLIALSGIVVRNSLVLIVFIREGVAQGMPLLDALVESGKVRMRPILLTAGTTFLGNIVITRDPIFSGLAWAIMFGVFASTAFTLGVIPAVYGLVFGEGDLADARGGPQAK